MKALMILDGFYLINHPMCALSFIRKYYINVLIWIWPQCAPTMHTPLEWKWMALQSYFLWKRTLSYYEDDFLKIVGHGLHKSEHILDRTCNFSCGRVERKPFGVLANRCFLAHKLFSVFKMRCIVNAHNSNDLLIARNLNESCGKSSNQTHVIRRYISERILGGSSIT